ncbi:hypothetical protein FO601_27515 [Bacillus thuringiensis]|nr:hypothetical protein [Bacillus thuringiensis]MDR4246726.1 hypothetical protein [Bacillus thuringiensis]
MEITSNSYLSYPKWAVATLLLIAGGCYTFEDEKVSENEFFQSVAAAIEKKDPSVIVNENANTHWRNWVEFDCD